MPSHACHRCILNASFLLVCCYIEPLIDPESGWWLSALHGSCLPLVMARAGLLLDQCGPLTDGSGRCALPLLRCHESDRAASVLNLRLGPSMDWLSLSVDPSRRSGPLSSLIALMLFGRSPDGLHRFAISSSLTAPARVFSFMRCSFCSRLTLRSSPPRRHWDADALCVMPG